MSASTSTALQGWEERLQRVEQFSQEVEAMLLIAQRTRNDLLLRQEELREENERLSKRLSSRRAPGSSRRHRSS